jgi:putative salt-induced outer membrane protein YdiY
MRFFLIFLQFALLALGDEVRLKNGDRLTGTVTKFDDKELRLKTEYAGDIRIKREMVEGLQTADVVNVTLKDGQSLVGKMKTEGEGFEVETATTGQIRGKVADLTLFRSKPDQEAYLRDLERLRNPRLVDLWTGSVDLGYAQARGNAITSTVSSAAKATRTTPRDAINAYFFSLYSANRTTGVQILAANSIRGGIKYDMNITPRWYAFLSTDLEFDEFQSLDLRFVPAGGLGYNIFKNTGTTWAAFGGGSMNREFFNSGLNRTSGEVLLGNDLAHKFGGIFTLTERTVFFNNVTTAGNYRLNADVALAASLRKWISFQVATSNRYLSNPLPGRKTNDVVVTTGIRLTFAK